MAVHETYLTYLLPEPTWQKFATALVVGASLVVAGKFAAARLLSPQRVKEAVVPDEKFSLFAFFDIFIGVFVKFYDSILGSEDRRHLPFVATVFAFIFTSNLLGLVPGIPAITTTVWVNVAMALVVFVYFNWYGVKANGFFGYLKHFCGPLWYLAPIMFILEAFSTCLRILTLNLRLYWNITADHEVLGAFTHLLGMGIPALVYFLGTFVCFMQAFIFTTLTMVYILLATQHEEESGH